MSAGVSLVTGVSGAGVYTQPPISNSNVPATTAFVNQQIISSSATVPFSNVTGGIYNQATLGSGVQFVALSTSGALTSVITIVNPGVGYAVGDIVVALNGNYDAVVRVTGISGGGVTSMSVAYGGSGYATGLQSVGLQVPPGDRFVTFSGALTSNVTFIITSGTFLTASRRPCFANNTTGGFTVTVFLSNGAGGTSGSGVVLTQGTNNSTAQLVVTDGVNDVWKVA